MTLPDPAPTVPGTLVHPPTVTLPRAPSLDGARRHSREDRNQEYSEHLRLRQGQTDLAPWSYYRGDPGQLIEATPTTLAELLAQLDRLRPEWHRDAACAGEPVDVFFPGLGQPNTLALQICGRCPVRIDCLDDALADPALDHGVRGGMTANARKARRRNMRAKPRSTPGERGPFF
jgi:WhiB family redox-sensing transcriptional regulator